MPGIDGYETAALIRQRAKFRETPILFLTAHHRDSASVERGYRLGAVDYLLKPPDGAVLHSKVSCFVELAHRSEELRRKNAELEDALRRVADYDALVQQLQQSKEALMERVTELEQFEEAVVGRELRMIALEKEVGRLQQELEQLQRGHGQAGQPTGDVS